MFPAERNRIFCTQFTMVTATAFGNVMEQEREINNVHGRRRWNTELTTGKSLANSGSLKRFKLRSNNRMGIYGMDVEQVILHPVP